LFYKGSKAGYVQPKDLANLDICITTYDILKVELAYTNAYEFTAENARPLRNKRRFTTVPCSLLNIEWWRICLDEAQMVHSTNSKCAEMANRLKVIILAIKTKQDN